ncbi:MAG: hypothetical protein HY553_16155 [Elusimicrobia bacterium]|nr:hypothetical protein [Elusimicrobiota bacterium]
MNLQAKASPKRIAALAAALVALALMFYAGATLGPQLLRLSRTPSPGEPGDLAAPLETFSPFTESGRAARAALLANDSRVLVPEKFTLGALARLLSSNDPSARAFADAFWADPFLRSAWMEFGKTADAGTLLQALTKRPHLRLLVRKFDSDPGFQDVALGPPQPALPDAVEAETEESMDMVSAGADILPQEEPPPAPPVADEGERPDVTAPATLHQTGRQFKTTPLAKLHEAGSTLDLTHDPATLYSKMGNNAEGLKRRDEVLKAVSNGASITDACKQANATAACQRAFRDCQADPVCRKNMSKAFAGAPRGRPTPGPTSKTNTGAATGTATETGTDTGTATITGTGCRCPPPWTPKPRASPPHALRCVLPGYTSKPCQ